MSRDMHDSTAFGSGSIKYNFKGVNVLVTGAGGLLGRSIVSFFSSAGASVILHVRKSDDSINTFMNTLVGDHFIVEGDLSHEDDVVHIFKEIREKLCSIDVLVNNAGLQDISHLKDIGGDDWDRMMSVNLKAPHLCTREFVRMRGDERRGEPSVINIASIEAESPACGHSHYGASKGGLVQYSRASALELGPLGFRVNSVSPGVIYREGIETDWPDGVARYGASAPMSDLVHVEDVTASVLFLASDGARGITGINLRVDKGIGVTPGY